MIEYHKSIVKTLSLRHRIDEIFIESMVDHVLKEAKNSMGKEELPDVLIHNFGRFSIRKGWLVRRIREAHIHLGVNPDVRLDMCEKILILIKAYKRKCKEDKHDPLPYILEVEEIFKKHIESKNEK